MDDNLIKVEWYMIPNGRSNRQTMQREMAQPLEPRYKERRLDRWRIMDFVFVSQIFGKQMGIDRKIPLRQNRQRHQKPLELINEEKSCLTELKVTLTVT